MKKDELILRARKEAQRLAKALPIEARMLAGGVKIRKAVIVSFGKAGVSELKVTLDSRTGKFISAEFPHHDGRA